MFCVGRPLLEIYMVDIVLTVLLSLALLLCQVFSLAPMMEYTDRHMRFMLRLLTKRTVLWTEMVPSNTIWHNADDLGRFLAYNDDVEHPVVLQVRCWLCCMSSILPSEDLKSCPLCATSFPSCGMKFQRSYRFNDMEFRTMQFLALLK